MFLIDLIWWLLSCRLVDMYSMGYQGALGPWRSAEVVRLAVKSLDDWQ